MVTIKLTCLRIILISCISLLISFQAIAQWTQLDQYPTKSELFDLSSPDGQNIYVVGEKGYILHTSNQGETWNRIETDTCCKIIAIDFPHPNYGLYIDESGSVYKSTDTGLSWSLIGSNPFSTIYKFEMIDSLIGYISGNGSTSNMYKTDDGGQNWSSLSNDLPTYYSCDFHFTDYDNGWITAYGLYKTTDGGQTVSLVSINGTSTLAASSITFIDSLNGWLSTSSENSRFYKTSDGGQTWSIISYNMPLGDISFSNLNDGIGLAGGLQTTIDGGITWKLETYPTRMNKIKKLENNYWSCGDLGKIFYKEEFSTWLPAATNLNVLDFKDISILNDSVHCYVDRVNNNISYTNNGGNSFHEISIISNEESFHPNSIWMESEDEIWVGTSDGKITHTTNRGLKWFVPYISNINNYKCIDIQSIDDDHIAAIFNYPSSYLPSIFVYSTSGGYLWDTYTFNGNFKPIKMYFTDSINGWLCDEFGEVAYTTDGGISWDFVSLSPGGSSNDMHFLNNQTGFIFGEYIYKTIDGGLSWDTITNDNNNYLSGHFTTEYIGWAMGVDGIWYTEDGGSTWILQKSLPNADYDNTFIEFYGESYGIALTKDKNTIYQDLLYYITYNGGLSWIELEQSGSYEIKLSNQPNPFINKTEIEFSIMKKENIGINIYDVTGKLTEQLINNKVFPKGSHKHTIHTDTWKPGIYFCKLSTTNSSKTIKIVRVAE